MSTTVLSIYAILALFRFVAALALGEIILLGKHACLEQEDVEEARTTLENMLFDKVPGVRASVQAVLSLRQLGGNMEQVPKLCQQQ